MTKSSLLRRSLLSLHFEVVSWDFSGGRAGGCKGSARPVSLRCCIIACLYSVCNQKLISPRCGQCAADVRCNEIPGGTSRYQPVGRFWRQGDIAGSSWLHIEMIRPSGPFLVSECLESGDRSCLRDHDQRCVANSTDGPLCDGW